MGRRVLRASNWSSRNLVTRVAEVGIPSILHRGKRRRRRRSRSNLAGSEARASSDPIFQLSDSDPLTGVELKDAGKDGIQLLGHGEDGSEKSRVFHVRAEGTVLTGGAFPGIASTGQVHEDNAQAPDVIRC